MRGVWRCAAFGGRTWIPSDELELPPDEEAAKLMTDHAQGAVAGQAAVVPKPSNIRPRPLARQQAVDAVDNVPDAAGVRQDAAETVPDAGGMGHHAVTGPNPAGMRQHAPETVPDAAGLRQCAAEIMPQAASTPRDAHSLPNAESRRGAARALEMVLTGVRLGGRDRQFLSRLVHWDKRNAASVASLLWRARLAGRAEAALTPRQLETVLAALGDAAAYRSSDADATGCWDCENLPGSRCADHARDAERARAYADLAVLLSGRAAQPDLLQPTDISGYRHRTPVAS